MTGDTVGGVWNYSLELARSLAPHGIEITLATMGGRASDAQRREAAQLKNLELVESDYRLEWMENPWEDVRRAGRWLHEIERRVRPDLVHLNGYVHGALKWNAPCLIVAHSCVLSWWRAVKGKAAPASWDGYKNMVTRGLRGSSALCGPTRAMLNTLAQNYGEARGGRAIFNARAPYRYKRNVKQPFILTAGRLWDEAKNVVVLEHVAADVPWPILAAGERNLPHDQVRGGGAIGYLGQLSNEALAQYRATASIYVLPARYEPFGLSALEAAMCGCALVLGDIPSLREVWEDTAIFVAPDDRGGLRDALRRLIESSRERQRWAESARERAAFFTPEKMAKEYRNLYGDMLAGGADG